MRRIVGVGERAELIARELEGEGAHIETVAPRRFVRLRLERGPFGIRPRGVFGALPDRGQRPAPLQAHLLERIGERLRGRPAEDGEAQRVRARTSRRTAAKSIRPVLSQTRTGCDAVLLRAGSRGCREAIDIGPPGMNERLKITPLFASQLLLYKMGDSE